MAPDSPAGSNVFADQANLLATHPVHPVESLSPASATAQYPERDTGPVQVNRPGEFPPAATPAQAPAGPQISQERLDELEGGFLRQSDYTRKTQDLAARSRALEEDRRAFEASKANNAVGAVNEPPALFGEGDIAALNEEVPQLGDALGKLGSLVQQSVSRQDQLESALRDRTLVDERRSHDAAEDRLLEEALSSRDGQAGFDRGKVLNLMQENGMGGDAALLDAHVEIAYRATAGFNLGRAAGAREEVRRVSDVPPVMGSAPTAIGGGLNDPGLHAAQHTDPAKDSWGDVTAKAMRAAGYEPDALG